MHLIEILVAALGVALFTLFVCFPSFRRAVEARAGLVVFVLPLALLCIAAAPAGRDYFISTLRVYPAATANGTNSVTFYDKAGTNWFGIAPTNGTITLRWSGTNYSAVAWTNISTAATHQLVFKNGILVQVN